MSIGDRFSLQYIAKTQVADFPLLRDFPALTGSIAGYNNLLNYNLSNYSHFYDLCNAYNDTDSTYNRNQVGMRPGITGYIVCALLFICLAEGRSAAKQMAVIVNSDNGVEELTSAEVAKIFKCDTRRWTNGAAIKIVVRDPATPEMELLLSRIYRTTPEELRSFIAAHKDAVVIVDSNEAMLNAVHTIPGAIGLVDVFLINKEVKVVKIDGKLPVEYGYILRGN